MIWLRDEDFLRSEVPMTKEEVRMISCLMLGPKSGDHLLDIGGGTGAMAIQLARFCPEGSVVSIESKPQAYRLMEENKRALKADNLTLMQGQAPLDLPAGPVFDGVFVGGSGGNMKEIFSYLRGALKKEGALVMNFILLESLQEAKTHMQAFGYQHIQLKYVQIQRGEPLGKGMYLKPQNGIFILGGIKK